MQPENRSRETFTITLPDDAEAAGIARHFVEEHRDDLADDLIEDAQLLVSEIVTNAVLHGRPDITLAVRPAPPGLGIVVTDGGDGRPQMADPRPDADRPSGRGLLILEAVASAWGVVPTAHQPGKAVWFDLVPR